MKIAILHFHLNSGGVTQVIKHQTAVLKSLGHDVVLLSGKPPELPLDVAVEVIQGLGYDQVGQAPVQAKDVATQIMTALRRYGSHLPDVLHVHNPILGKNRQLLDIIKILQTNGVPFLCQVHDFAEDGRPDTFCPGPYPSDCHYAVINLRDYHILRTAGLKAHGLHYLPNPVLPWTEDDDREAATHGSVLYPVRAIRRKNIGEAILVHCCRHSQRLLLITLPPTSASDMPAYDLWRRLVDQQGLNVVFEAGLKSDFKRLTSQCDYVLTTSITEGFGFAFLEAWTGYKLLSGRLLPDICRDFLNHGIQLNHLYRRLMIPLSWIKAGELQRIWSQSMRHAARQFGIDLPEESIAAGWHQITSTDHIDFGLLDEGYQHQIVCKVIQEKSARDQLCDKNPALQPWDDSSIFQTMIHSNREAVLDHYSSQQYSENLMRVYDQVVRRDVEHEVEKKTVGMRFLVPDAFSLLKWRPFHG